MKLMTKTLAKKIRKYPLYSQDGLGLKQKVIVKFFNPVGAGTWIITEGEEKKNGDYLFYGYCNLGDEDNAEMGYVLLSQLKKLKFPVYLDFGGKQKLIGELGIERDLYLNSSISLGEVIQQSGFKIPKYL